MPKLKHKPRSIGCYIRISDKSQNADGQRAALAAWLESNGIDDEAVEWFSDTDTGTRISRASFDRMQEAIHAGRVRTVVCYKVDRISRQLREGLNVLCEWCDRGLRFVSVTQAIDVSGTVGRMVAALLLGFGEIEHEYRAERQALGIAAAKKADRAKPVAEKTYKGRAAGTTKGKPARAAELKAKGLKADEIATAMGVSLRTVWRYLGPQ